jgi:hypothetical protein
MKKPRGDSKLKTLPDALQEELFQRLRRTTGAKVRAWLQAAHELDTSEAALSEFFSWYARAGWVKQSVSIADQLKTQIAQLPQLKEDAKTVSEIAQVSFEIMAAQNRDSKFFLDLMRERREQARLALDERKVKILEAKAALADAAKAVAGDANLTEAEQLIRYKQIFGG